MSVDWNQVEWYSRSRSTADSGPSVTISKGGRIVLNEQALALLPEVPEAFQVGVVTGSRGKATLVLQAASKSDSGSLVLNSQGRKYSLNTKKFLTDKGLTIHFGTAKANKLEYDKEHNALIANL